MTVLSSAQREALNLVLKGEVKYVRFPLSRKDKPYFIVSGLRSANTLTYKSLVKQGFIRASAPSLRSVEVLVTKKGEKLF